MSQLDNYTQWVNSRFKVIIEFINNKFGESFLNGKTMLELGAGYGEFGNKFYEKGAILTCWEGRKENLDILEQKHPQFTSKLVDIDKTRIEDNYDIILHAGVLYHIKNVLENLENCLEKCNVLILETENIDSTEDNNNIVMIYENESHTCDTSSLINSECTNYSSRTTRKFLESVFIKHNFKFILLNSPISNCNGYIYNWTVKNTKNTRCLRSIYVAYKE